MAVGRIWAGVGMGAMIAAGLGASPALFAQEQRAARVLKRIDTARMPLIGFGSFTPASADPQLAAAMSRTALSATAFQFTPSEGTVIGSRAIKAAVRVQSASPLRMPDRVAAVTPTSTLNPVAYNLGTSASWKRLAASGDMPRLDLVSPSIGRDQMGLGVNYPGRKLTSRVSAIGERAIGDQAKLVADTAPGQLVDMGGSYKLTRNLDVTAGVRYRTDRERMLRIAPERRDSQAIYVGTAFRF